MALTYKHKNYKEGKYRRPGNLLMFGGVDISRVERKSQGL
jgi:hypothetical protein